MRSAAAVICIVFAVRSYADELPAEKLIKITTERDGDATHFYVENLQSAEVTVTFETMLSNLESRDQSPQTATYPGKQRLRAFTVSPIDKAKGWSWSYTYYATLGNTTVVHDPSFVYSLPYAPGKSFKVSQGFNGEYSHFGPNQFAVDWKMPVGTAVHAARPGLVVGSKDNSDSGGPENKYDSEANYVLIRHADGTLGQYVHLKKGGNQVSIGDVVRAGQLIGFSGNTGHTTGPHLHFSVFKAKDGKQRQSLSIRFETAQGPALTLQSGKSYTALQPPAAVGWVERKETKAHRVAAQSN